MSGNLLRILVLILAWLVTSLPALAFQTAGKSLIIMDFDTGAVLAEKNADVPLPPASMSKLMTINMVFEALSEGRLTLDLMLPVSEHAASYGGSSMFLKRGERISVEDLLRGVVVLSGNDASAVFAEALSPDGTEEGFAELMNARARELGMTNSVFANSNGWPDPRQKMSTRDLAILSARLIRDFPELYRYFAETEFLFDQRVPENKYNRNPLLKLSVGADGLKTGYTSDAGYGLAGSATRDGRRVVFVVAGLDSRSIRTHEAEQIVIWYFVQFASQTIFSEGETVARAPVWMGSQDTVATSVEGDAQLLTRSGNASGVEAVAIFDEHLEAPIVKGEEVGTLLVSVPELDYTTEFPLVAAETVERTGYFGAMMVAAKTLFARYVLNTGSDG